MNLKINDRLWDLVVGILLSGGIIQLIYFIVVHFYSQFRSGTESFALGLWIGVGTAVVLAVHMYYAIEKALEMEQDQAEKYIRGAYAIRTAVILVVAGIVWFGKTGYVMSAFLGILCLKFGEIFQPLLHKLFPPRK